MEFPITFSSVRIVILQIVTHLFSKLWFYLSRMYLWGFIVCFDWMEFSKGRKEGKGEGKGEDECLKFCINWWLWILFWVLFSCRLYYGIILFDRLLRLLTSSHSLHLNAAIRQTGSIYLVPAIIKSRMKNGHRKLLTPRKRASASVSLK